MCRQEQIVDNMPNPQTETNTMRRSGSESDFSVAADAPANQYRVRKSSLIG